MKSLEYLLEPVVQVGHGQCTHHPKKGLLLFGPDKSERSIAEIRIGVVGTIGGIALYKKWVERLNRYIEAGGSGSSHLFYPGFSEIFDTQWTPRPAIELAISGNDLQRVIRIGDRYQSIYDSVSIYENVIRKALTENDQNIDTWFVVIPDEVYAFGRPQSRIPNTQRVEPDRLMNLKTARKLNSQPSLFSEDMDALVPYQFTLDFHHQLKARLLDTRAVTQVVRESSLLPVSIAEHSGRRMQDPASVAWNISVTTYFKSGGRPWKVANVRPGVCYIGLVFKKTNDSFEDGNACCGAQMFLDSGDGVVFKGTPGLYHSPKSNEFHLTYDAAKELLTNVMAAYQEFYNDRPKEIFLHGKTYFNEHEWSGFVDAAPKDCNIVGVRITRSNEFKIYRRGSLPVARGSFFALSQTEGYLWTTGFVPALGTYPGREVPNPLLLEVVKGQADIGLVANDVMALTKLNFNSCIYGDGLPVTLRFADTVGEILTAAPLKSIPPLPFRHYI